MVRSNVPLLNSSVLIVGEGAGDEAFLKHLCAANGIQTPQFENCGGKGKFLAYLNGLQGRSDFGRLRLIVLVGDCDDGPDAAFKEICDQVKRAKLPVPNMPFVPATRGSGKDPSIVVFTLPIQSDGRPLRGALETVLLAAATTQLSQHTGCVDAFIRCVFPDGSQGVREDKVRFRSLLSAANPDDPNHALQWAINPERGLIDYAHQTHAPIVERLKAILAPFAA